MVTGFTPVSSQSPASQSYTELTAAPSDAIMHDNVADMHDINVADRGRLGTGQSWLAARSRDAGLATAARKYLDTRYAPAVTIEYLDMLRR